MWDPASRALLRTITAEPDASQTAAISPDGRTVAVPGDSAGTRLVDVASSSATSVLGPRRPVLGRGIQP